MVVKLDRLAPSVGHASDIMERSVAQGWSLVMLDIALDTTTPNGEALANMMATFVQLERRLIGERTKAALAAKKAQGARLGRPRMVSTVLTRRVVSMRQQSVGFGEIARELTAAGELSPAGRPTSQPSTVRRIYNVAAAGAAGWRGNERTYTKGPESKPIGSATAIAMSGSRTRYTPAPRGTCCRATGQRSTAPATTSTSRARSALRRCPSPTTNSNISRTRHGIHPRTRDNPTKEWEAGQAVRGRLDRACPRRVRPANSGQPGETEGPEEDERSPGELPPTREFAEARRDELNAARHTVGTASLSEARKAGDLPFGYYAQAWLDSMRVKVAQGRLKQRTLDDYEKRYCADMR